MTDEEKSAEDQLIDRVEAAVGATVDHLVASVDQQMSLLEKRIDAQDELLGGLFKAYTEMYANLEGIISEVMSPRDEEEREQFRKDVKTRHVQTLQMMQKVGRETQRSNPEDPTASILEMVGKQQDSPPFGQQREPDHREEGDAADSEES